MDQDWQANDLWSIAADGVDCDTQPSAVSVMRPNGDRRDAAHEPTEDWAAVQALTFTANGLAG